MKRTVRRYDFPRAGRELKALLDNPDELSRVFGLLEALQGSSAQRLHERLAATAEGRALLAEQPDVVPMLSDREALRAMPAGSLAHAYLAFVEQEHLSAEGLLEASASGQRADPDDGLRWQRAWMRDTHDLWHAVTGYQGDVLGEVALLAFYLAQTWHPGIALAIGGAFLKGLWGDSAWVVADGFVRGRRAAWLASQRWDSLMPLPLAEVRARLKLGAPPSYQPVRSAQLRTQVAA